MGRGKDVTAEKHVSNYFILAYVIFWLLLVVTGLLIALKIPQVVQTVMATICAWSPTFAFLILHKNILPGVPLRTWLKNQLPKVGALDFIVPAVLQVLALVCASRLAAVRRGGRCPAAAGGQADVGADGRAAWVASIRTE